MKVLRRTLKYRGRLRLETIGNPQISAVTRSPTLLLNIYQILYRPMLRLNGIAETYPNRGVTRLFEFTSDTLFRETSEFNWNLPIGITTP